VSESGDGRRGACQPPALATVADTDTGAGARRLGGGRGVLIERFAAWLDRVLALEEPPAGVARELLDEVALDPDDLHDDGGREAARDRYALQSQLTVLAQEAKLQGRSLHGVGAEIASWGERLEAGLEGYGELLDVTRRLVDQTADERARERSAIEAEARRSARREMLELAVDLRERAARSLMASRAQSARARAELERPAGLLARLGRRGEREALAALVEATAALETGAELGLARIDEILARWSVRQIECIGRPFDPNTMTVVEVATAAGQPDGTVVAVRRPGYLWEDALLRPARGA